MTFENHNFLTPENDVIQLNDISEKDFIDNNSDICIYGLADGESNSELGHYLYLKNLGTRNFFSAIFTKTNQEITDSNGILDTMVSLSEKYGGEIDLDDYCWSFNNSYDKLCVSRLVLLTLFDNTDIMSYGQAEYNMVFFNRLDMFREDFFWYLFSRVRSSRHPQIGCPVEAKTRASINITQHSFVRQLIHWYVGKDGYVIPDRIGQRRWLVMNHDTNIREQFSDCEEAEARMKVFYPDTPDYRIPGPVSLSFIPSKRCKKQFIDPNNY